MKSGDKINALFEYPGKVIIVDDDVNFSQTLASRLKHNYTTAVFNSPVQAIDFFDTQQPSVMDKLTLITELDNRELDTYNIAYTIDYTEIGQLVADANRYNEPTVLIVDYEMPQMSGLEFLFSIRNRHIKKILLTAYDEKSIAVKAFNQGLIDRYLIKEPDILDSHIFDEIKQLNQDYFKSISSERLGKELLQRLYDPAYDNLLSTWIQQFGIQELYRIDDFGSVVGLSSSGSVISLALCSKERVEIYTDTYNEHHTNLLKENSMIYFFSEDEESTHLDMWGKFVYPIEGKLETHRGTLYYTIIKDAPCSLSIAKR